MDKVEMELEKVIIRDFSEKELTILLQKLTKFSKNLIDHQILMSLTLGFHLIFFFLLF